MKQQIDPATIDICSYLDYRGIPYEREGKNVSDGWIGTQCLWCDDTSNHLGINLETKRLSCWRCSVSGTAIKLMMKLEQKSFTDVLPLLSRFSARLLKHSERNAREIAAPAATNTVISAFSDANITLSALQSEYLKSRRFDPTEIQYLHNVRGFGPAHPKYPHRLAIPYYYNNSLVTFSTRDVTGKVQPYLHFPKALSLYHPKELLYGEIRGMDTAIVVEGVTDQWRLGKGTVALSGTKFTAKQVLLLSRYKRLFTLFDSGRAAQRRALQLAATLSSLAHSPEVENLEPSEGDPAEMTEEESKYVKRLVFGKIL